MTTTESPAPWDALIAAIQANDTKAVTQLLADHPELAARLNEGTDALGFGATPLIGAVHRVNRAMIDALLAAGADINARSDWWAGGFSVLDNAKDQLAPWLIERGATLDPSAAAKFGMITELKALLERDPDGVHHRGGDGKTPLHWARDVATAKLLVAHGADINARDVDHESTPAQYAIGDRPEVARYLVSIGAEADLFLAAALGDMALAQRIVERDPRALELTIDPHDFPMQNPRAGGSIYTWTIGQGKTPHLVAYEAEHRALFDWLMSASAPQLQLMQACLVGDEALFERIRRLPGAEPLPASMHPRLVDAAVQNNTAAVRLFLAAGCPVETVGRHKATALHWAAWHGNVSMVQELVRQHAPLEVREGTFGGTPLGWALHGSTQGWHARTGDYGGVVTALLAAGAERPATMPGGVSAAARVALGALGALDWSAK